MYRRHEADDCARQTVSTRELSAQVDCPGDGPQAFRERRRGRSRESAGRARELGHVAELLRSQAGAWPAPDRRATKCTRERNAAHPLGWADGASVRCGGPGLGLAVPGLGILDRGGSIPSAFQQPLVPMSERPWMTRQLSAGQSIGGCNASPVLMCDTPKRPLPIPNKSIGYAPTHTVKILAAAAKGFLFHRQIPNRIPNHPSNYFLAQSSTYPAAISCPILCVHH